MSMNKTPAANRLHIGFFGRRNSGKSSLVNAVTGQNLAIVSEIKGTTTDPVFKAMELLPLGPVVIIDTPGYDDEGELGKLRVERTLQVLRKTDVAVLVLDGEKQESDEELVCLFKERNIPFLVVLSKSDLKGQGTGDRGQDSCSKSIFVDNTLSFQSSIPCPSSLVPCPLTLSPTLPVSAKTLFNIDKLKEELTKLVPAENTKRLVADLIKPLDIVVLVIPIDSAAPKGRLILPQQQVLRDILDAGAVSICVKETELRETLEKLRIPPSLVITDSQAFALVSEIVSQDVPLTSFSILFARYKGFLDTALESASALDSLKDGDKVLICEGCTHHRQCDDIGTVKLPALIRKHTSCEPVFEFTSGGEFPNDLSPYKIVIHCGACMLNEREMIYRRNLAKSQGVPFTNYGVVIAHTNGILKRCTENFLTSN